MKEETIRRIAKEKGLKNEDLFVRFFSKRFPDESDGILSYVSEWADRFNTGTPERHMDNISKDIYLSLL